ncbi:MAG TPA: hypothetical protein VGL42_02395 [Opitutaceae bacterium]|jgi:hypothetical protein
MSGGLKFEAQYAEISAGLKVRFRLEVDESIEAVKSGPSAAGHFVNTGSVIVTEFRRRNLRSFLFFVLYGWNPEVLAFGCIVPTRSDPLSWLARFGAH